MSEPSGAIEELETERAGLLRSAIHLCSMILADATGSKGGGTLSQHGAMLDLEVAAIRYVRRLDELSRPDSSDAPSGPNRPSGEDGQN
jgi:hypothetical protein